MSDATNDLDPLGRFIKEQADKLGGFPKTADVLEVSRSALHGWVTGWARDASGAPIAKKAPTLVNLYRLCELTGADRHLAADLLAQRNGGVVPADDDVAA